MNTLIRRVWHREDGQVLYMSVFLLSALLGMAALSIDIGVMMHAQRELQATADAAATAGAIDLSNNLSASTAEATATAYSGVAGEKNAISDLSNVTMVTGYPQAQCLTFLTNLGLACTNTAGANAMAVEEQGTATTYFAKLFGVNSITLTAKSLSSMKGSSALPYNIMLVVDTTQSMQDSDSTCKQATGLSNPTREDCAKGGIQTLLSELSPCSSALASCGSVSNGNVSNPVQEVGMMIFPGLSNSSYDQYEYDCQATALSAGNGIVPYSSTTNYSVIGLSSDYKTSDSSTSLNSGQSHLVDTATWANQSGCTTSKYGLQDPGGEHTYYAGAITAAQAALSDGRQGVQNAIILLSDGDANASYQDGQITQSLSANQCTQAVNAAKAATQANTWVYVVAYGSETSGCSTDNGAYTPCSALQAIASDPSKFYSDDANGCASSAHPSITSLSQIFQSIGYEFLTTRLLPWGTT